MDFDEWKSKLHRLDDMKARITIEFLHQPDRDQRRRMCTLSVNQEIFDFVNSTSIVISESALDSEPQDDGICNFYEVGGEFVKLNIIK